MAAKKKAAKKVAKKPVKKAKPASKKTTAKKSVTKKKPAAKPAVVRKKPGDYEKVKKTRTKSQILTAICEHTAVAKKDIGAVFDCLGDLIGHDLSKGPGTFTVPGLMKVVIVRKPATKARKGVNPFTGEEMMFKAKPARNVVRVRPLKGLKDKV